MTRPAPPRLISHRSFCALSAVALASPGMPARAFAEEAASAAVTPPIVIVHTNDAHCAVDENPGYAKLATCVETMSATYDADNVTLVDAGDAVQGRAMGTLTDGECPIDIMNECGYGYIWTTRRSSSTSGTI